MRAESGEQHVLVVTANEGRRIQVVRLLRRSGYRVQVATSPRETLHTLAQGDLSDRLRPDLIMVDQESLGVAAQAIIRAIRNAELGVQTVVLSAFAASDDVITCLRAGAADYISLPAEPQQILDVLRRVLAAPSVI